MKWWNEAQPHFIMFVRLDQLGSITPRASLAPVILAMEREFNDFYYSSSPNEAQDVRNTLSEYMYYSIESLELFLAEQSYGGPSEKAEYAFRAAMQFLERRDIYLDLYLPPEHHNN